MWKLVNDWQQRLSNTYVLLFGKPFYISNVQSTIDRSEATMDSLRFYGRYLEDEYRDEDCCDPIRQQDNKGLDLSYNPCGYANIGSDAVFIRRKPSRYYKYCVTRQTLLPSGLRRSSLEDCLLFLNNPDYPSFEDVVRDINQGCEHSIAFNKNFSLNPVYSLFYKGMKAGHYNGTELILLDNFKHLSEKLEDVNVLVR